MIWPQFHDSTATAMTSATEKICRILSCLSDRRICKLTDIARFTDLDISSVLRILKDLEKLDFVEREPQTKEYTLGREIYAMHHAMVARQDIRALARPALVRMARKYGDSLILSIPSNWESVCVDTCLGDYPIRANYLEIGSRRPLGVGAGSLVLLAALSDAQQQMYLPCIHEQIDKRYPMFNQSMLKTQIALCRQQQYAVLCDVVVKQMGGIRCCHPGTGRHGHCCVEPGVVIGTHIEQTKQYCRRPDARSQID